MFSWKYVVSVLSISWLLANSVNNNIRYAHLAFPNYNWSVVNSSMTPFLTPNSVSQDNWKTPLLAKLFMGNDTADVLMTRFTNPLPVSNFNLHVCHTFSHGTTRLARTGASHFSAFSTFQRIKSLYEALEQVRRQSVSQRAAWCCLHAAAPRRVPTGGSLIHVTSFIMLHHSLRQQLNVLLHLAWENMLRCIPVWWGSDFFSLPVRWRGGSKWAEPADGFLSF